MIIIRHHFSSYEMPIAFLARIQDSVRNPRWRPESKIASKIQDGVLLNDGQMMKLEIHSNFFQCFAFSFRCSTLLKSNTSPTASKSSLVPLSVTGYVVFVVTSTVRITKSWGAPKGKFYQAPKNLPAPGGLSAKVSLYCRIKTGWGLETNKSQFQYFHWQMCKL